MWYTKDQLVQMLWEQKANSIFVWVKQKTNKFWNEKVWWVDSKKEYNRMQELQILERAWKIKFLKFQVPFLLQEWFERNWKKIREIKYISDFVYLKEWDKKLTVEDTKGFKEKTYLLKRKLFLHRYWKTHYFLES
jgi:hypothetical protein